MSRGESNIAGRAGAYNRPPRNRSQPPLRGLGGGGKGDVPLAPSPKTPGLYVHVPFCRGKCHYCDFYSIADISLVPVYLEALERETRLYQGRFATFDTLYLGGGTPSLLSGPQLTALIETLHRHFSFAADTEITIEANPDDLYPEKLALLRDLGINRLSVGVQSLDDAELRFLGRRHPARQAEQALKWARDAGFDNLGVDLIYALPGQEDGAWCRTLKTALGFQPEHLSCYQLTLSPDTPLGQRQIRGEFAPPAEEAQRRLFLLTSRFLEAQGYRHYEVANFARGEARRSRHNLKYWQHDPYLGLGPGAHSFDGSRRWWHHASLDCYFQALTRGQAPVAGEETLTPEQLRLEACMLGLRTREGLPLKSLSPSVRTQALPRLTQAGLMKVHRGRLLPTRKGLLLADRLPLWLAD